MKKLAALTLTLMLAAAVTLFAAPAHAASGTPIGFDDFTFKLEKGEVNILTKNYDAILRASGKKFTKLKRTHDEDYGYALKTKTVTFYAYDGADDIFCYSLTYTKKGVTPRGIKIGSTEAQLLAAYPAPESSDEWEGSIYYRFGMPGRPSELTESDMQHIDDLRPGYFYVIIFEVNAKTRKVKDIGIMQDYWG